MGVASSGGNGVADLRTRLTAAAALHTHVHMRVECGHGGQAGGRLVQLSGVRTSAAHGFNAWACVGQCIEALPRA